MYYLMNKDNIIAEFNVDAKPEFSDNVSFSTKKLSESCRLALKT